MASRYYQVLAGGTYQQLMDRINWIRSSTQLILHMVIWSVNEHIHSFLFLLPLVWPFSIQVNCSFQKRAFLGFCYVTCEKLIHREIYSFFFFTPSCFYLAKHKKRYFLCINLKKNCSLGQRCAFPKHCKRDENQILFLLS